MREYCITFGNEEGEGSTEVYHCHVTAPLDSLALEAAFRGAMLANIPLKGTTLVAIKVFVDIPSDVLEGYEALRQLTNVGKPEATPEQVAPSHLH